MRLGLFLLLLLPVAALRGEPPPTAQEILQGVRLRQTEQQIDLEGQLRQNDIVVPFHLAQDGAVVRYIFSNPDEALQLELGDADSRLDEVTKEGTEKVKPAQFDKKVRGTDVTYEDLALKFLYWPKGEVLGSDIIRTRNCWKLQLTAPSRDSQYGTIWLWVDKESGALMRMEGYDMKGKLLKRFEVVSAQKFEKHWFLKQMRIEQFDPATKKVTSRTYLEIKKPEKEGG